MSIIDEMENKIANLVKPKNFTCLPVLIHVNGITDELDDEKYFYKVIDFSSLL